MKNKGSFYGWTLVGVLFMIYFFSAAFPYSGGSVINTYMAEALNMERSSLGLGFTLMNLISGLSAPLIAFYINRVGVRITLVTGAIVVLGGALLMNLAVTQVWQFTVVFGVVIGLGFGFSTVIPIQTAATFWFNKRRSLAMSIALSGGGLGSLVAASLINYVITAAGGNWRVGWVVVAVTSMICIVLALLFVRNKPSDLGQVPDGIRADQARSDGSGAQQTRTARTYRSPVDWRPADALRTVPLWLIIFGIIAFMAPFTTSMAHGVIHLRELNHAPEVAAMSIGVLSFASIFGRLIAGFLADRIEPRFVWATAIFSMTAGTLILLNATSVALIYIFATLMGFGFGASMVCVATITGNYYGAGSFASVMGVEAPISTIAGSLAPFAVGLGFDIQGSYATAFYVVAAIALLGGLGVIFARPPKLAAKNEKF